MFGYLKTRPDLRAPDFEASSEREADYCQGPSVHENNRQRIKPQSSGYLSWESISYFFGRWTSFADDADSSLGKPLAETEVDSDIKHYKKKQDQRNVVLSMEKTMEYTVTLYDTLPKIALKFNVTPSELTRLNKLAIRTLYPGQVLRVPCPQPADNSCTECADTLSSNGPPESMTMDHHHAHKAPIAKRVSFDDIDEDVLETFLKVKSKYITDGQGVVKGFLLITAHAVIFHPDVSEILVVDRGSECYQVQFPMRSVCAAGLFDDIAQMVVHDPLHSGHFLLDKPLLKWFGDPDVVLPKTKNEPEEEGSSCSTLHPSMCASGDDSVDSLNETSGSLTADGDHAPRTTTSEMGVTNDNSTDVSRQASKNDLEVPNQDHPVVETAETHSEDVVVSSSCTPRLANDESRHPLPSDTEQLLHVTSVGHTHQMNSTPKLGPYKEPSDEGHVKAMGIDRNSEGRIYNEGISRDSGIDEHFSRENVHNDAVENERHHDSKTWMEGFKSQNEHAFELKEIIPRESTCHVDMPKYLCVRIKKACWPELRPRCCRHAHEDIQKATDERREFWFSIPSERLFDIYGFFLEWCPAIHDGETDEEKSEGETDLVGSCDSDYSVITMSEVDNEGFKLVDNFYSRSPDNTKKQLSRKRLHSREKKKQQKAGKTPTQRRESSWSMISIEEPLLLPEMIGKSEILTESDILQLSQKLPSRTIGHSWRLIYSTYVHGTSLKTLYRTMADYDTPALLVILDQSRKVFGAFASSPFAISEHFYGTGECFLYSFSPDLKVYCWSGENNFFIKGDIDSLAFGGGQGNFGLWLDEDLCHGSSHRCKTFDNEPLAISEDFLCSGVETWCFE